MPASPRALSFGVDEGQGPTAEGPGLRRRAFALGALAGGLASVCVGLIVVALVREGAVEPRHGALFVGAVGPTPVEPVPGRPATKPARPAPGTARSAAHDGAKQDAARQDAAGQPGPHSYRRVLYLMRGAPGSGKSTLARAILKRHLAASGVSGNIDSIPSLSRAFILSSDDFFASIDQRTGGETYKFDSEALESNHNLNQKRCATAMALGITPLIVDNTHTRLREMRPYVELARLHGYEVEIQDLHKIRKGNITLDLLRQRCAGRTTPGKDIADHVLVKSLQGYEPLPDDPREAEAKIMGGKMPRRGPGADAGGGHRQYVQQGLTWRRPPPLRVAGVDGGAELAP